MFALTAGAYREITRKEEYSVLVCGPESSGKLLFLLLNIKRVIVFTIAGKTVRAFLCCLPVNAIR